MEILNCPVCVACAEGITPYTFDGKSIRCANCGEYDISGSVFDPGTFQKLEPEQRRADNNQPSHCFAATMKGWIGPVCEGSPGHVQCACRNGSREANISRRIQTVALA